MTMPTPSEIVQYEVYSTDEHGVVSGGDVVFRSATMPTDDEISAATGAFGGTVHRLTDGRWNWGGGWHDSQAAAVAAMEDYYE